MMQFLSALESVELIEHAGVPRKALKSLLVGNGIGPGARVLVVGGGNVEFLRCLDGLGLLVTGFESSAEQLAQLRDRAPLIDWRGGHPRETAFLPEQAFDLVLVREHPTYRASLTGAEAFRTTADLLAAVRPLGTLAVLDSPLTSLLNPARGHSAACFAAHLRAFPGHPRIDVIPDYSVRRLFRHALTASHDSPFWIAQLTLANEALPRTVWRRLGEIAADQAGTDCCSSVAAGGGRYAA